MRWCFFFKIALIFLSFLDPLASIADPLAACREDFNGIAPEVEILSETPGGGVRDILESSKLAEKWKKVKVSEIPGGFQKGVWFRFRPSGFCRSEERTYYLSHFFVLGLKLFRRNGEEISPLGSMSNTVSFFNRLIPNRNFIFPLGKIGRGEMPEFYLQAEGYLKRSSYDVRLFSEYGVFNVIQNEYIYFGVLGGIIIFTGISSFLVFLRFREKLFLFHTFFSLGLMGMFLGLTGLGFQFVFPNFPLLNIKILPVSIGLILAILPLLTYGMTPLRKRTVLFFSAASSFLGCFLIILAFFALPLAVKLMALVVVSGLMFPSFLAGRGLYFFRSKAELLYSVSFLIFTLTGVLSFVNDSLDSRFMRNFDSVFILAIPVASTSFLLLLFTKLAQERNEQLKRILEAETSEQMSAFLLKEAEQVSHDIRSPLAAINLIVRSLKDIPEEAGEILSGAVNRINEIAENLLKKRVRSGLVASSMDSLLFRADLRKVLEAVIREKGFRREGSEDSEIRFECFEKNEVYVRFSAGDLGRIFSNLINNSFEAYPDRKGKVFVRLEIKFGIAEVTFRDFGCGIPQEIMEKVGQRGFSFGKGGMGSSGSGLGIYHAKQMIEEGGGRFSIESTVQQGTLVTLQMPILKV